jgi:hypothetical protein
LFVTGDTHSNIDIRKLRTKLFPESKSLSKDDYVLIVGDFGLVWDNLNEERYWQKWLANKPFTTLFIDGNHENFDLLNAYPVVEWKGGKIHKINESIYHLMRGQVYEIDGMKIFTFGGAKSSDIQYRKEHKTWWKEELPTAEEYMEALINLEKCSWEVDFIVTHTCPTSSLNIINERCQIEREPSHINDFFETIKEKVKYRHWYFGHFHQDIEICNTQTIVYNKKLKIF